MDPDKIRGDIQRPFPQQEPENYDKIDPEKFKRVMKVDASDEAQKRNKRNLKREEEEGEDDKSEGALPSPPISSFSEFMQDRDELGNVFDKESGGVRHQASPQNASFIEPPSPGQISTQGVEVEEGSTPASSSGLTLESGSTPAPSSQEQLSSGYGQELPLSESEQGIPLYEGGLEEMAPPFVEQTPSQSPVAASEQTEQKLQPVEASSSEQQTDQETGKKSQRGEEVDTSLLASQPTKEELQSLKKKKRGKGPAPEIKTSPTQASLVPSKTEQGESLAEKPLSTAGKQKGTTLSTEEKTSEIDGEIEPPLQAPLTVSKGQDSLNNFPQEATGINVTAEKEGSAATNSFTRYTPEEIRNQRLTQGAHQDLAVSTPFEGEKGEMGQEKRKEQDPAFPEAALETAGIPLPTFDAPLAPVMSAEDPPAYSQLSPEVYELFEKMGGVILVQQDKGITTTTMDVNLPNSVFNGAQVIINQYSTAPNSYNIQLVGTPEAVALFNQNLDSLKDSFKQGNYNFEANILTPALQSGKKPHLIRRKGAVGDEGSSGGGGGGKKQNGS